MPELPEVETIVNDLRPQLAGRRIESVILTRDTAISGRVVRYPSATKFVRRLRGRTINAVEGRGKYIVLPLKPAAGGRNRTLNANGGHPSKDRLIVHLGMTGHLRDWEPEETPGKQTHFRALLESALESPYADPRWF